MNLQIVGVGGQGILLSSKVIGGAALDKGLDVWMSEVHGMAQRGGVVVTTVKIGEIVYSPLIGDGEAHAILGFEPVETYRAIKRAAKDTWIVTNIAPIVPFTVSSGKQKYPKPDEIFQSIEKVSDRLIKVDAKKLAQEAGAAIAQNIVMLGALTATDALPFSREEMENSIRKNVPEKFVELNLRAFDLGFRSAKEQM